MSDQELAEKQRMLQERQAQLAALQAQRAQMENQQQQHQGGYPQQQQQGGYQQQQANWGYAPHMHHHQGPPQHRQHGHHHHHHSQHSAAPYRGGGGGGGGRGGGGYQPQQQWGGQQGGASQWGQAPPQHQHQHHHSRGGGGGGGGKYQQHQKPVYTEEFVDDDDEEFDEDYDEFEDYVFEEDAAKANAAAPVGPDKDYEEMVAEAEAAAADRSAASGGGAQLDSDEVFAMAKNPDSVKARTLGDYAAAGKLKNLRDNDGRTVLHYVAETSFADLAKQVASTVDATVADENGMLAADVAAICGNKEMCAALGADPAQRGALLKKFRVLPPRFAVVKSAPKQKPKRRGAFWGNPVSNPDPAVTLKASELGDASTTVPEVEAAAFVIPATPLDWTKPSLSFSEEYHARIHSMSVAARDTVIATADVTPIGNILVNGEKQAQAAYAVGCVRTQRGGLRHLANFVAGYLQQCVAGFVSPTDLGPVMPPVCAIKWYQRSVNAMAALAGPAASLLFPDVNKYYSVTRTDVLRKHDVAPEDAAAAEWRVATDDDALTMAGLFAAKNGDFVLSFDPSEEAVKHLFFGCNVVSLVTNDGSACAVFQKRDQRGHESAILVASSLSTSAGLDDVCSAVRRLMPDVATVYAATLGLSDYCLSGANFALIDGSHQHFYAACDPSTPVLTGAQASKVRFPLFF